MQKLEKILEEIKGVFEQNIVKELNGDGTDDKYSLNPWHTWKDIEEVIRKHMNGGWIPAEKALPRCEEEVFIQTERGTRTTAMYEDGTMREEDSIWNWCDIDGDWDEERDCMIIPKGWWEYRHFNPDDVYNNVVDEKVIAWRPLPEPYQPERRERDGR